MGSYRYIGWLQTYRGTPWQHGEVLIVLCFTDNSLTAGIESSLKGRTGVSAKFVHTVLRGINITYILRCSCILKLRLLYKGKNILENKKSKNKEISNISCILSEDISGRCLFLGGFTAFLTAFLQENAFKNSFPIRLWKVVSYTVFEKSILDTFTYKWAWPFIKVTVMSPSYIKKTQRMK